MSSPATKGHPMPVGEVFLYAIWALLALGAIIATAKVLHDGD